MEVGLFGNPRLEHATMLLLGPAAGLRVTLGPELQPATGSVLVFRV